MALRPNYVASIIGTAALCTAMDTNYPLELADTLREVPLPTVCLLQRRLNSDSNSCPRRLS